MRAVSQDTASVEESKRHALSRLYPWLSDPNYLILRGRRKLFQRWLAGVPGNGLRVLDIGGRVQPYRRLVEDRLSRYVAVDVKRSGVVDIVGMAEQLPLISEAFDLVFCTCVLEYTTDPRAALAEIHRVLKPGGVLLLSVSGFSPRFDEAELWRFQPGAVRMLLAGFSKYEVVPEGTSVSGVIRCVSFFLVSAGKFELARRMLRYLVALPLNLLGSAIEALALTTNSQFSANYSALAQK